MVNFRNKYLVTSLRIFAGLFFVFSGVTGWMAGLNGMEGVPEPMVPSSLQLWDMGIFQMIKTTETVAGLMLIVGFLPALALLFLAPIPVGVIVYNSHVAPQFVISGVIAAIVVGYLGYAYWEKYQAIFQRN